MVAWRFSSTAMKAEILAPCPFCGSTNLDSASREAALRARVAELEIIAEQAEARVAELEAALREVEGDSLFPSGGAALRALREMAHDMDLLLELNAALKWETQWLAQGRGVPPSHS